VKGGVGLTWYNSALKTMPPAKDNSIKVALIGAAGVLLAALIRGLSFYATFVLDESGERAYAMWEQSGFSVQMAGKRWKEFGADELEAWPSQFLVLKGFA
jgi:hypothetical protein